MSGGVNHPVVEFRGCAASGIVKHIFSELPKSRDVDEVKGNDEKSV
jgi:hypothetical protein